jgi:hypothetical protein
VFCPELPGIGGRERGVGARVRQVRRRVRDPV